MLDSNFVLSDELIKNIISYFIPVVLAVGISYLGNLVSFLWNNVIKTWRVIVLLLILAVTFLFTPTYCLWVTLVALTIVGLIQLNNYRIGYIDKDSFNIVFSGFYAMSEKSGKLLSSGNSKILNSKVFDSIEALISDKYIQEFAPIKVINLKIPKLVYAKDDYEKFRKRMENYATNNLGVIWGIIDDSGKVKNFEITVKDTNFTGGKIAQKTFEEICQVFDTEGISNNLSLQFTASTLSAIWGQCLCDLLNDAGNWQSGLQLAKYSKRLFIQSLDTLREKAGKTSEELISFERKRILPLFIRQEALSYRAGKKESAITTLLDAVKVNPFHYFYNDIDFAEYYNIKYVLDIGAQNSVSEKLQNVSRKLEEKLVSKIPPNLELLINWLEQDAYNKEIENLNQKVDIWFSDLAEHHPKNPFVYLYWADAERIKGRALIAEAKESGLEIDDSILPVETLDKMIKKCETAYTLDASLSVVSARLGMLYLSSALHFKEGSAEFNRRIGLVSKYKEENKKFIEEYLTESKR